MILEEEVKAKKIGIKGVPCFIINNEYVIFGVPEKSRFIDLFNNRALYGSPSSIIISLLITVSFVTLFPTTFILSTKNFLPSNISIFTVT